MPAARPGAENDVFQLPAQPSPVQRLARRLCRGAFTARQEATILNPELLPGFGDPGVLWVRQHQYTSTTANSIYNAGQITVERKANDVTFLAAYTFAKGLDDSSAFDDLVNFTNPKLSRGLSSTDITHNFVASYIWAIPFDRAFGNAPKRLTQGWQIQGITRFSTGFPGPVEPGQW